MYNSNNILLDTTSNRTTNETKSHRESTDETLQMSKAQGKNKNHKYKGLMRPRGDVLLHPAGPTLL